MLRLCLLVLALLLPAGLLWFTELPLGIPGEWTWDRNRFDGDGPWKLCVIAATAAGYLAFIAVGMRQLAIGPTTFHELLWIAGLWLVAGMWLWQVQECSPAPQTIGKGPFVLYYPGASGYFYKARYEEPDPRALLKKYEALMQGGDVLHVGTHPPGLFLLFHGLIGASQSPGVQHFCAATQPESFTDALDIVKENSAATAHPLTTTDRATLWLASLLALACAAGTVVPVYWTLRIWTDRGTAFVVAAMWPTIPAVAMFLPKSDAAFPCLAAWLMWVGIEAARRRSWGLSALYGFLAWLGLLMTLAYLPVLMATGLLFIGQTWDGGPTCRNESPSARARRLIGLLLVMACGFFLPIGLLNWWGEVNLLTVWRWNYINHAGFYQQFPRTYWKWLLINPLELAVALGGPLFITAILGASHRLIRTDRGWWRAIGFTASVWGLLWLTGKNSGEAARLWLPLMPWMLLWASPVVSFTEGQSSSSETTSAWWQRFELQLLAAQLVACWTTVARVSGFHFPG